MFSSPHRVLNSTCLGFLKLGRKDRFLTTRPPRTHKN
jgi:hypothetical protein